MHVEGHLDGVGGEGEVAAHGRVDSKEVLDVWPAEVVFYISTVCVSTDVWSGQQSEKKRTGQWDSID